MNEYEKYQLQWMLGMKLDDISLKANCLNFE